MVTIAQGVAALLGDLWGDQMAPGSSGRLRVQQWQCNVISHVSLCSRVRVCECADDIHDAAIDYTIT